MRPSLEPSEPDMPNEVEEFPIAVRSAGDTQGGGRRFRNNRKHGPRLIASWRIGKRNGQPLGNAQFGFPDDLPTAIADARKTIQAATDLIQKASTGKGALATLLSNQELANDLKALVTNLRAHGVLFYRDDAAKAETQRPPAQPRKNARP